VEESTKRKQVRTLSICPCQVELTDFRYGFLLNRYMVPTVLAAVIYSTRLPQRSKRLLDLIVSGIAGFISMDVSDIRCKHILAMSYVLIVLSMGISTLLVILRVIALWAHSRVSFVARAGTLILPSLRPLQTAVFALWSAFIVSQCTTLFCAVMTIVRVLREPLGSPMGCG
jgi:hypothetical protein